MFNFTLDLYTTTCKSTCDITTTTTTMNVDVEISRLLLSKCALLLLKPISQQHDDTTDRHLELFTATLMLVRTIRFQRKEVKKYSKIYLRYT